MDINEKITAERNSFYWNDKKRSLILQNIYFKKVWLQPINVTKLKIGFNLDTSWSRPNSHIQKNTPRAALVVLRLTTEFYSLSAALETTI